MNRIEKLLFARKGPQWSESKDPRAFEEQPQPQELQALTAVVTGTFRDNFPLVLDISQYQQVVKWAKLKEEGIKFVWVRSSFGAEGTNYGGGVDALCSKHVQDAYDAKMPIGLYHAVDIGYYEYKLKSFGKLQLLDTYLPIAQDEQIQTMIKACKYKKYYAIAIDFELWKDWNGNALPDGWLVEGIFQFLVRVHKVFPDMPVYLYTGSWFVWNYCKSMEQTTRIKSLAKLWTAYYPYGSGVVNLANVAALKPLYPPNDMTITFPDGKRVTQNPPYLGFDGWNFWQFSGDKFTLPYITDTLGRPSALDFNFYNGTVEKLYAEIGYSETPVPTPDHTCPTGQHWDDAQGKCVADIPTPTPDPELVKRVVALETQILALKNNDDAINAKLNNVKNAL